MRLQSFLIVKIIKTLDHLNLAFLRNSKWVNINCHLSPYCPYRVLFTVELTHVIKWDLSYSFLSISRTFLSIRASCDATRLFMVAIWSGPLAAANKLDSCCCCWVRNNPAAGRCCCCTGDAGELCCSSKQNSVLRIETKQKKRRKLKSQKNHLYSDYLRLFFAALNWLLTCLRLKALAWWSGQQRWTRRARLLTSLPTSQQELLKMVIDM